MPTFVVSCSADYFPQFLVLHASLNRWHPEARIVLRTFGDIHSPIPHDVEAVPMPDYDGAIARERPSLILRELDRGDVCFLGADMELFGRIEAPHGDIVLTPHHLRPIPIDAHTPALAEMGHAGFFNSDFQYVRAGGRAAYQWLAEVCEQHCFLDNNRWCNEQGWLSHLPCLFPGVTIWRNTGVNCAPYNVMGYGLREENGAWLTEDGPLVLMHYSGFRVDEPSRLSRFVTRHKDVSGYPVGKLLAGYAERVLNQPRPGAAVN